MVSARHAKVLNHVLLLINSLNRHQNIIVNTESTPHQSNDAGPSAQRTKAAFKIINDVIRDSELKPDIVTFYRTDEAHDSDAQRFGIAIIDPTVTNETQLRRENTHFQQIFNGLRHFHPNGRVKSEQRQLFPDIPGFSAAEQKGTFFYSAFAEKSNKYSSLLQTIKSRLTRNRFHITEARIIPLIFGSLGGLHNFSIEALDSRPFVPNKPYDPIPGQPTIPRRFPHLTRYKAINEDIFDSAITIYRSWKKNSPPSF